MKKNIFANIIGKFWSVLSGFIFIPLYIKFLGFESYSVISFTLIIAGMMAVLDSGLTATLSREFARKDQVLEEKYRIFNTLETTYFLIVCFISVIVFSLSNTIASNWLNLKGTDPDQMSLFIKIIGFEIGFQMLLRFYIGGVLGFEQQVKANMYQIAWGIFRNGLVIIAIYFVPSLKMFFSWQLISTIVFVILMRLILVSILKGNCSFTVKMALDKNVFLKVGHFASGMLLISLVAALNSQMDKLAVSKFLDITNLGFYTLAVSVAVGIYVFITPISTALLPRFTALYSAKCTSDATLLFEKVNMFIAVILFSIMANMIFFAKELIWVWTGDLELAEKAGIFLPILSFSYSMIALQIIPFDIAVANGYTKLNNLLGIMSLFLTLPGYWIATKFYGAIGAAYVFCCVQTLVTFVYLFYINKKFLSINLYELYIRKLMFPLIICMSVVFGLSFIPNFFVESRILTFLWIAILTGLTLFITILIIIPIKEIRSIIELRKFKN